MVSTDNKKNISRVADLKAVRVQKNFDRLTRLTASPRIKQRTEGYIMALTNAERQKAYKARQKESNKRLDLMIPKEDFALFSSQAKDSGVSRHKYLSLLLHGNAQGSVADDSDTIQARDTQIKRLKTELRKAHQANVIKPIEDSERLKLKQAYNAEHEKVIALESKNSSNRQTIDRLKREYDALLHKEHNCMAATQNGQRCTKKAVTIGQQGFLMIHLCRQHAKAIESK